MTLRINKHIPCRLLWTLFPDREPLSLYAHCFVIKSLSLSLSLLLSLSLSLLRARFLLLSLALLGALSLARSLARALSLREPPLFVHCQASLKAEIDSTHVSCSKRTH